MEYRPCIDCSQWLSGWPIGDQAGRRDASSKPGQMCGAGERILTLLLQGPECARAGDSQRGNGHDGRRVRIHDIPAALSLLAGADMP